MIISLIAALTLNHVIGIKNKIPWYLPVDIKWFKYHTLNKPVIMGRKTFESIGKKPLLNRLNIILSHHFLNGYNDVCIANNPDVALFLARGNYEVMIIGGSSIYNIFFSQSTRLYLTYINTIYIQGDTWFPSFDINEWRVVFNLFYKMDEKCCYDLNFKILERFK